jgi:hypothetical protein
MSKPTSNTHPCVLYTLEPGDEAYDREARFRIDFADGGQVHFRSQEGSIMFAVEQGFVFVSPDQMDDIRKTYAENGET